MAASMQAAPPSSVAGQTFLITGKADNECRKASLPCITCSIGCMQVATQELAERLPGLWPLPRGMSLWPIRTGKRQLLLSKGSRLRHQMPRWRQCTWIWHPSGVLQLAVGAPRQKCWCISSTPGDLQVYGVAIKPKVMSNLQQLHLSASRPSLAMLTDVLSPYRSIKEFAEEVKDRKLELHALINNAGQPPQ